MNPNPAYAMPDMSAENLPHAILFDLDNTLCTFVDAKQTACQAVIRVTGSGSADDLFRYFLRPVHNFEDTAHISDYFKDLGMNNPDLEHIAKETYEQVKLDALSLYPHVKETLEFITQAAIPIAVVTDADWSHAKKRMDKLKISNFFPVLITQDIAGRRKPDHKPFHMALEALEVKAEQSWIVGDSLRREMAPGIELGMTTVFAKYGDWIGVDIPEIKPRYTLNQFHHLLSLPGLDSIRS
ncbi:MAG TPA: HAD family hydrolase [Methanospirillum sp.]|nr:HAD family hydrolase [Methanospirillum sp.]